MNTSGRVSLTSVRFSLILNLAIPLLTSLSAFAQNPPAQPGGPPPGAAAPNAPAAGTGSAEAERVIGTGSNIPPAEEVRPNPALTDNPDIIEKTGVRTTEEFLRNLPAANATGVPVSNNENGS